MCDQHLSLTRCSHGVCEQLRVAFLERDLKNWCGRVRCKGQGMTIHSMTIAVLGTSMVLSSEILTCSPAGLEALFCHSEVIAPSLTKTG